MSGLFNTTDNLTASGLHIVLFVCSIAYIDNYAVHFLGYSI